MAAGSQAALVVLSDGLIVLRLALQSVACLSGPYNSFTLYITVIS